MRQLSADISLRTLQAADRVLLGFLIPEDTDICLYMSLSPEQLPQLPRKSSAQLLVFDPAANDVAQFRWTSAFTRVFLILFFFIAAPFSGDLFSLDFHHLIGFHIVAFLDIIIIFKYETTFISGPYFLDIVLESLKGCKRSVEYYNAVANQADRTVPLENTVLNVKLLRSYRLRKP